MPETTIEVTKVQVGHIIGKGGENIKGIQSRSGAKVEIVEGTKVRITAETEAAVEAAAAEVRATVAAQENPDYEGEEGHRLRKEADELGDRRSKLFDEATAARQAGNHAVANERAEQAKKLGEEMKERHEQAAAAIVRHNNEAKGKGADYFDMHGLREEEAMKVLRERVAQLEALSVGTVTQLELIPGAGHHSGPAGQKLKAATEAFLKEKHIEYEEVNAGTLKALVKGTGTAIAGDEANENKQPEPDTSATAAEAGKAGTDDGGKAATTANNNSTGVEPEKPAANKAESNVTGAGSGHKSSENDAATSPKHDAEHPVKQEESKQKGAAKSKANKKCCIMM